MGYAHIGVWRVLERAGLLADVVAGTSIGAGVAALYALGYTPDAAAKMMDRLGAAAWQMALPTAGLLSNARLRGLLHTVLQERRIEDLDLPLAIVAADIGTRSEVVFRQGLIRAAVLASMAIPGIFPPVRMGRYTLVDGCVLNPVPCDVVGAMGADIVIAVQLMKQPSPLVVDGEAIEPTGRVPSLVQAVMQSIELMQSRISAHTAAVATIRIEPDLTGIPDPGLRHFPEARRYIAAGELAAEAALPRLAGALPWLQATPASARS
jgi:NTE family protein